MLSSVLTGLTAKQNQFTYSRACHRGFCVLFSLVVVLVRGPDCNEIAFIRFHFHVKKFVVAFLATLLAGPSCVAHPEQNYGN